MTELENYITAKIHEAQRAAGLFWCPFCGEDHLDTTAECTRIDYAPGTLGRA